MKSIRHCLWVVSGTVALVLGIIGIVLPLLPTTPFLLLSAFCYSKGSPRLHARLLGHTWLGGYIRRWVGGKGIQPQEKFTAVALLAGTAGYAMYSFEYMAARVFLALLFITVSAYIVTRPSTRT